MDRDAGGINRDLEALLERHQDTLRKAISRHLPASLQHQVEDVLQDVQVRLWRSLQSRRRIANPAAYLYRMAVNATVDAIRTARSRGYLDAEPLEIDDIDAADASPEIDPPPERRLGREELLTAVQQCMDTLSPDRQQAVRLYLEGMTTKETAAVMGWTEPKARNLTYRGLAQLREALRQEGITLED